MRWALGAVGMRGCGYGSSRSLRTSWVRDAHADAPSVHEYAVQFGDRFLCCFGSTDGHKSKPPGALRGIERDVKVDHRERCIRKEPRDLFPGRRIREVTDIQSANLSVLVLLVLGVFDGGQGLAPIVKALNYIWVEESFAFAVPGARKGAQ